MPSDGTYCFVSDVHLGAADDGCGARETRFVEFLRSLPEDVRSLFLLGDIFDFWVDYKDVVPRGYTRVFGELARLADRGCRIFFFKGNHDYWVTDYFSRELGAVVVDEPYKVLELAGKRFCVGHGDSLNCSDWKARLIFRLFRNRFLIRILRMMPVHLIFRFARWWSARSRKAEAGYGFDVSGSDILGFAEDFGGKEKVDYFVFGHFHTPSHTRLSSGGELYILGDWTDSPSCLYFSGNGMTGLGFPNSQR